ncbi:hypothetical protein [Gordonia caeni]|uniref:Helix-turn-helix domain-containing protein n=1 Tax=Gordonia caeni TaxID=1007097 RepID=A0ABP7PBG7_9ACTN
MTARITPEQLAAIDQLRAEGASYPQISEQVGVSVTTVRRRCGHRPDCAVEGCTRQAHSRGWCSTHWGRWSRHGTPVCKSCQADEMARSGLCKRCYALGADTERLIRRAKEREAYARKAAEKKAALAAKLKTPVELFESLDPDDGDPPACPRGCGRPRHYRPAIACPPIGLPACDGGQAQDEVA